MHLHADSPSSKMLLDVVYAHAGSHALRLDLHLPADVEHPPLVMFLHGGGWQNGDKAEPRVKYLVEHGYALASVNYRLTDIACYPAQIHDCKAAARYLRAHAEAYGYTADKLIVIGVSAGGHLASLMGTTNGNPLYEGQLGEHVDHSSRVEAVVNFFGPQDFPLRARTQPEVVLPEGSIVWKLLGGSAQDNPRLAEQASPAWQVGDHTVPFLSLYGDADRQVYLDQAKRLDAQLKAHRVPHQLIIAPGLVHGDARFFDAPYREPVLEFLKQRV